MDKKEKWYQLDSRGISNLLVVCGGILLYLGLTHFSQVRATLRSLLSVLSPFIAGFAIAYLLNTPTKFFERKVYEKLKYRRALSILTVYLIALIVITILLQLILPQVIESIVGLVSNVSVYLNNLDAMVRDLIQRFHLDGEGIANLMDSYNTLINRAAEMISAAIPGLFNFGVSVGSGVVSALTAIIASIYMLFGKDRLRQQIKKFIYAVFPAKGVSHILEVSSRANRVFVGFINGKLIDSAIIGVLCFLFSTLFRIPYAILVSVVVGVTNVIPFFGPIIGAIPCLMVLVIVNPWAALRFGILIIALQQFDGNILGPKILGNSTGLSAIWVLVAIVVGGGLFGFAGMLLGVPTFAVLYSLVRDWVDRRLAQKGINADGEPLEPKA